MKEVTAIDNARRRLREEDNQLNCPPSLQGELPHLWYYGDHGTGKSLKARSDYVDADLNLKPCNKWWDGHSNQRVLIIEDFDRNHAVLCHHLKLWALG